MADDKFKLPQSSYEELTKIIKAYGQFQEPADLTELSKLSALHPTIVSRNNGFLIAIGILEAGAKKILSTIGRELSRALEHEMPEEIRRCWQGVTSDSDFLSKVLAAIRIRSGMDQQTLEAHVAYSAGQPKKPQFMTGARTVIDILKAAEVIREVDGKFIAEAYNVTVEPVPGTLSVTGRTVGTTATYAIRGLRDVQVQPASIAATWQAKPQININVNVTCTPADLDDLGEKLQAFIRKIQKESDDDGKKAE